MVGWILDQSPRARIVTWAHNLHVQRQPGWMGQFLEDMFPGQMVVLGFATGTGTYRAVSHAGEGVKLSIRKIVDHLGLSTTTRNAGEDLFARNIRRRLYEGLGFELRGVRPAYYTRPVENALILWREDIQEI